MNTQDGSEIVGWNEETYRLKEMLLCQLKYFAVETSLETDEEYSEMNEEGEFILHKEDCIPLGIPDYTGSNLNQKLIDKYKRIDCDLLFCMKGKSELIKVFLTIIKYDTATRKIRANHSDDSDDSDDSDSDSDYSD